MVGLYDWEKRADGSQTCDILEVYSSGERDKLKQTVNAKILKHLTAINNAMDGDKNGSEFVFSDTLADIDNEREEDDDDDDDQDKAVIEKKKPIIPLKDLPVVKNESVSEQMGWLAVSVDDI
jgi:hypothetical protein